ncbi:Uu.00g052760.m01.CDS01 [Anthostomella pinea]|uniref:Uu.00g052760.m01.CDS01 n=1 Tax=Anthostomella pinea TaxID=933095 RepID=A0AAI8YPK8_9PEZI|nr:Uu.00g052760.m01.CDS01 [Anthostomella pinea]
MHFSNALLIGLLGFLSASTSPTQGLVSARTLPERSPNAGKGAILYSRGDKIWPNKPRIDMSQITDCHIINHAYEVDNKDQNNPEESWGKVWRAKAPGFGEVMFKLAEEEYLINELEVYMAVEGEFIAPEFLALVTKDEEVVGFLTKLIGGATAPEAGDEDRCVNKLEDFYRKTRLVHGDIKPDQFILTSEKTYLIDFELSRNGTESEMNHEIVELNKAFGEMRKNS